MEEELSVNPTEGSFVCDVSRQTTTHCDKETTISDLRTLNQCRNDITGFHLISKNDAKDWNEGSLLSYRCGWFDLAIGSQKTICPSHREALTTGFYSRHSRSHGYNSCAVELPSCKLSSKNANLRPATFELSRRIFETSEKLVPVGMKVCYSCRLRVREIEKTKNSEMANETEAEATADSENQSRQQPASMALRSNVNRQYPDLSGLGNEEISSQSTYQASQGSNCEDKLGLLNSFLMNAGSKTIEHVMDRRTDWQSASSRLKQSYCDSLAGIVNEGLKILAPGNEMDLWEAFKASGRIEKSMRTEKIPAEVADAMRDSLTGLANNGQRIVTLSLIADKYPAKSLKSTLCVSSHEIRKAKEWSHIVGRSKPDNREKLYRTAFEMQKATHFLEYLFLEESELIHTSFRSRVQRFSTGEKQEVAEQILRTSKGRTIRNYHNYCEETGFANPLGKSSLYKCFSMLPIRPNVELQGVDNYHVDGREAFKTIRSVISQLVVMSQMTAEDAEQLIIIAKSSESHMASTFAQHVLKNDECGYHCTVHSLSQHNDEKMKMTCQHGSIHDLCCETCGLDQVLIQKLTEFTDNGDMNEDLQEIVYELELAKKGISEWKGHILRSVHQRSHRKDTMLWLKEDPEKNGSYHSDWIQGYMPTFFREKQNDYFGKNGINWHNSTFTFCDRNGELQTNHFTTIFESHVKQTSEVGVAVMDHLLSTVKSQYPTMKKLRFSSDCGPNYHSGGMLIPLAYAASSHGMEVESYDFTEPGAGKGTCDAVAGIKKIHVRSFLREGNDVTTPRQLYQALTSNGAVQDTTVALVNIDVSKTKPLEIKGISSLFNFKYSPEGLTATRAYGIGSGQFFPWSTWKKPIITKLKVTEDFQITNIRKTSKLPKVPKKRALPSSESESECSSSDYEGGPDENRAFFTCNVDSCSAHFMTYSGLIRHRQHGVHKPPSRKTTEPLSDIIKKAFSENIATKAHTIASERDRIICEISDSAKSGYHCPPEGWSLRESKKGKGTSMSERVRNYLSKAYDNASKNQNNPLDIASIVADRMLTDFNFKERMSTVQIKRYFTVLNKKRMEDKNPKALPTIQELEEGADELGSIENSRALNLANNHLKAHLMRTHPISVGGQDLCKMKKSSGSFTKLSITKIRALCVALDLPVSPMSSKPAMMKSIEGILLNCECQSTSAGENITYPVKDNEQYYRIHFQTEPFANGVAKLAYKGQLVGEGQKSGTPVVVKSMRTGGCEEWADWVPEARISRLANTYAGHFKRDLSKVCKSLGDISFAESLISQVKDGKGQTKAGEYVLVEPFLEGDFTKYNSNGGWEGDCDYLNTFSHYTWVVTSGQYLICDLQGVKSSKNQYHLTDAAVHSKSREFQNTQTDLGLAGMDLYFRGHNCNSLCKQMNLGRPVTGPRKQGPPTTTYFRKNMI